MIIESCFSILYSLTEMVLLINTKSNPVVSPFPKKYSYSHAKPKKYPYSHNPLIFLVVGINCTHESGHS